jgi:hypothetical protein
VTTSEARQIAQYIQSLAEEGEVQKSLPLEGTITPNPTSQDNVMVLTASYTDKGLNGVRPLTGVQSVSLSGSTVSFSGNEKVEGFSPVEFGGQKLLILPADEGWFALENIDLKRIKSANLVSQWREAPTKSLDFEMHLNAPDGPLLGKGSLMKPSSGQQGGTATLAMSEPVDEKGDVYFVYKPNGEKSEATLIINSVRFDGK